MRILTKHNTPIECQLLKKVRVLMRGITGAKLAAICIALPKQKRQRVTSCTFNSLSLFCGLQRLSALVSAYRPLRYLTVCFRQCSFVFVLPVFNPALRTTILLMRHFLFVALPTIKTMRFMSVYALRVMPVRCSV